MLVYRVCYEKEMRQLFHDQSFENVGEVFYRQPLLNNHPYDTSKKYLHFFPDYDSLLYFYIAEGSYICSYDIPSEVLDQHEGMGRYYDRIHMEKPEFVPEFAIPTDELDFQNLVKVDQVKDFVDYEDFYLGEMDKFLKPFYNRDNPRYGIQKVRRKLKDK